MSDKNKQKDLHHILGKGITVGANGVSQIESSAIEDYLSELGLASMEEIKKTQTTAKQFVTDLTAAFGEKAHEAAVKDKSISSFSLNTSLGADKYDVVTSVAKEIRSPQTNEKFIKYGHTQVKVKTQAVKSSALGKVIRSINDKFSESFSD